MRSPVVAKESLCCDEWRDADARTGGKRGVICTKPGILCTLARNHRRTRRYEGTIVRYALMLDVKLSYGAFAPDNHNLCNRRAENQGSAFYLAVTVGGSQFRISSSPSFLVVSVHLTRGSAITILRSYGHPRSRMPDGVTAAPQILVLLVEVRILVGQPVRPDRVMQGWRVTHPCMILVAAHTPPPSTDTAGSESTCEIIFV